MHKYELAVVLDARLEEDGKAASLDKVKALIERFGGQITNVDDWGKKKLAYEIRKESKGYFYFIKVDAVPEMAVELEKEMRLRNETVLRYLILREGE